MTITGPRVARARSLAVAATASDTELLITNSIPSTFNQERWGDLEYWLLNGPGSDRPWQMGLLNQALLRRCRSSGAKSVSHRAHATSAGSFHRNRAGSDELRTAAGARAWPAGCGSGLLGRPASEYGRLCHGEGGPRGATAAGGRSCRLSSRRGVCISHARSSEQSM